MKRKDQLMIAAAGVVIAVIIWFVVFRGRKESYGASPYGAYASEMITQFPPAYQTVGAVKAVLGEVYRQMFEASTTRSEAVPCAHVVQFIDLTAALSEIPIMTEWELRRAVAILRRFLAAVAGENCLGGYTTFARMASQVATLIAAL